ncbi:MAG: class I SAM-dependent methyltransferase [Sphingobacteriales bacterium]|jgi:SAM-dependent methyltransferase|nr:class I SAM-dependent methyltransferase [Sphingobacteriales bacterium]
MHIRKRTTCRVCGSSSLKKVIDLGPQYLQGSFVKPGKEMPSTRKIGCSLVRCNPQEDENACGLLQMEHSVPSEILYAAYWYRSGTNNTMRNHLKDIVDSVANTIPNIKHPLVLDIGCNDGTLLGYYPKNFIKYGCDPSDVAQEVKEATVVQDIFPSEELFKMLEGKKLDVITSIAMFYDLEDPVSFVKGISRFLAAKGVWVFEMSYMPRMLELDSYDTICHEHLEFYSLAVLEKILAMGGMKIFKISFNEINGGSIRCYATHKDNSRHDSKENYQLINEIRHKEFDLELDTDKPYDAFQQRIEVLKTVLHKLLVDLKNEGKKVHVYGASTKGNTILQWCNIDHTLVEYAAERNPDKYGARTLGTDIPIISEEESRAMNPDYYLVLPWHFKAEFMEREKEALDKGTGFIFPVPRVEIYKR